MSSRRSRLLLLAVLIGAVALFFALGLNRFFSIDFLKASQAEFARLHEQNPWGVTAVFFGVYVLITALSLPGAAIMTLAAGASFGLWWGTVVVSLASTLGATLAMLAARYLLREMVERRFGPRLAAIDAGIEKEGAFYLFTLRLIPVVPFFMLNLLMGLTRMRAWTFFWVSQIGMFAGTVAYVNAGVELGRIDSLAGVLSPALIGSFALLGLLPLVIKRVLDAYRRRRVYARWRGQRPRRFDRNLIVIGAGAGGLVSAYIAAAVKAKVTLVEAHRMGGDCLNTGCVPSKALIRAARAAHEMRQVERLGLARVEPRIDWPALMRRVQAVVRDIEPHDSVARYTALGVDVRLGHARIVNPWTVEIRPADGPADGPVERLSTRAIVIAAGAAPIVPPLPGLREAGVLTSDTLWDALAALPNIPARITVLGGGPIGCELAQALQRLGAQVTQVEMADHLLPREDAEVSDLVAAALRADGVRVLTGHQALRCEPVGGAWALVARGGEGEQAIAFDAIVCAVGRAARLSGYGLEELGIAAGKTVPTDEYLATLYPNIYAAGDVAGPYQFTHAAAHQAWYAAVNALFGQWKRFKVDDRVLPTCTFVDPEVARVGLNEREAQARGVACEVTRYPLQDLDRAIAEGAAQGFVKLLTVPGKDRILGVTAVGASAGEWLAEYVLAMKHGLGLNRVLGTVHSYPTFAEANKYAAGEWKRAHAPEAVLRWVRRYHDWQRGER